MIRCCLFILVFFFCISEASSTSDPSYLTSFRQYTSKDGLASDRVFSIHKDKNGFLWIGTEKGLNRFDGRKFRLYPSENQKDIALPTVHEIFEDGDGFLWLVNKGTSYDDSYQSPKIVLLNTNTGEFTSATERFGAKIPFKIEDVRLMKMLADGRLFFYCKSMNEAFIYESDEGFSPCRIPSNIDKLSDVQVLEDGHFMFEILSTNPEKKWSVIKQDNQGQIIETYPLNLVVSIRDKGNHRHFAFDGLNQFSQGHNLEAYVRFGSGQKANATRYSRLDHINQTEWNRSEDLLWFIGKEELTVCTADNEVIYSKDIQSDERRIPIFFDGEMTWWSNKKDGLMSINLKTNHFANYRFFEDEIKNSTRGIYLDQNDVIWVSTIHGSAKVLPNGKVVTEETINHVYTSFMEDSDGALWYFDETGLVNYNFAKKQAKYYPMDGGYAAWSLLERNNDEVWFSSHNGVISKLNRQAGQISNKSVLKSDLKRGFFIYDFQEKDSTGYWLCTNQGLYEVNKNGREINIYHSNQKGDNFIPTEAIHHMYQDENNIVWLATGDAGLLKLKFEDSVSSRGRKVFEVIKQYTINDGLSSNALHAIYEDDFDYLWISSDNGLMQFDKRTEQIFHYFENDGISNNEFNRIAHHRGHDGRFFFGGLSGVTSFYPKHFSEARNQKNRRTLTLATFEKYSSESNMWEDKTNYVLEDSVIRLMPHESFFRIDVSLLDSKSQQNSVYQYRIPGVTDWVSSNTGSFNIGDLPYGSYQLQIRGFERNLLLSGSELSFSLLVVKPFYLRWWFLLSLLLGLAYVIRLLLSNRKKVIESRLIVEDTSAKNENLLVIEDETQDKESTEEQVSDILRFDFSDPEDKEWLEQVDQIAKREIKNSNYNIEDLSKELFMSKRHLYRRIKKVTNVTPKKYLNSIRLQKAKDILENESPRTLTEVCYAIGFENTTHFANLFEAEYGIRPHDLLSKSQS